MKKNILAILVLISLNLVWATGTGQVGSADGSGIQRVEGETQVVKLKGKFATVLRSNRTADDKEEIKKCGKSYTVFLLDKPIRVSLTSMEGDEKTEVVVQHLRTWGNVEVEVLEGETVEVKGVIGEEALGLCSPGLAIEEVSFYPNAK